MQRVVTDQKVVTIKRPPGTSVRGVVDQDDLDQVLFSFNTNAGGDIDGDLITRQFDLELVLFIYGQTCP